MDATFENIYKVWPKIFTGHRIDLGAVTFFDPWGIGLMCLKAIEHLDAPDKGLALPTNADTLHYLKRVHFDTLMRRLTYESDVQTLTSMDINERDNPNVCEIMLSEFRDQFSARLSSAVRRTFLAFGMSEDDERYATALVGELGNNVYDHNEGSWPTDARGAIVIAQHYPKFHRVNVAVADPGVGFLGSLKLAQPGINDDVEAIKLGLTGVTGRIGENRGNGLRLIQRWTLNRFRGILRIHSGAGLVIVDQDGQKTSRVPRSLGTLAELVIFYK